MKTDDEIFTAPAEGFACEPGRHGKILQQELDARELTANALALKLRVPPIG